MTDNYLGEIRLFSFKNAPKDWQICDGTLLNIRDYQALYALIGTTYGGDGRTTFAVPDLRGRTMVSVSQPQPPEQNDIYVLGDKKGAETVTLSLDQTPVHYHLMAADDVPGNKGLPGNVLAIPTLANVPINAYNLSDTTSAILNSETIGTTGGDKHNNMQPFLTVNFCIALSGIFPPRP